MDAPRDYWDAIGREKSFAHPLVIGELDKHAGRASSILDFGCGYGRIIRELYESGFVNLFGVDFSPKMIERAKKENPFARYEQNAGLEIPFPDGSFDAILLLAVLTCIPSSTDQARLFVELHRALKARGILYLSDCLINDDRRNQERYRRFEAKHGCYGVFELEDGGVMRHHSLEHLERLAGPFKTLLQEEFRAKTMNGHHTRAIRMVLQKRA